jgi:hypothetical protein
MTMANAQLERADCQDLGLWISRIFIILSFRNMNISTEAPQVVMNFLRNQKSKKYGKEKEQKQTARKYLFFYKYHFLKNTSLEATERRTPFSF